MKILPTLLIAVTAIAVVILIKFNNQINVLGIQENALVVVQEPDYKSLFETPVPSLTEVPTQIVTPSSLPSKNIDPASIPLVPFVTCRIHEDCGGGTRTLKKSECINSICCWRAEGSGRWEFYISKDQCIVDQEADKKAIEAIQRDIQNLMTGENTSASNQPSEASQNTQPVYVIPTKDPSIIQKCIDNINAEFKSQMASCSYFGGGSASFQCEESYRRKAEAAKLNCR